MKNCWFSDNNCNGALDEILDEFFNFPLEDVETDVVEQDWNDLFKNIEEPSLGVFSVPSLELSGKTQNANNFSSAELSHIDRRNIVNSSLKDRRGLQPKADGPTYGKTIPIQNIVFNGTNLHPCQAYSPVSVFESSSYSSVENSNIELPVIPTKRPRSKRRRLSSFDKLFSIPFIALPKQRGNKSLCRVQRKQRKNETDVSRKCTHCEVTETPQWREGPMGSKTLCNACGVRYRSGRLFPEYRPAASPTFKPSVHSNSHKKVLEIRKQGQIL